MFNQQEYDDKKDEGVRAFLQNDTRLESKDKQQRDSCVLWIRENTELTIKQVAEVAGVSERTIDNILRRHGK